MKWGDEHGEYRGRLAMWTHSLGRNRDTTTDSANGCGRHLVSLCIPRKFSAELFVICVDIVISTDKVRVRIYSLM